MHDYLADLNHNSYVSNRIAHVKSKGECRKMEKIETKMHPFLRTIAENGCKTTIWRPKRIENKKEGK